MDGLCKRPDTEINNSFIHSFTVQGNTFHTNVVCMMTVDFILPPPPNTYTASALGKGSFNVQYKQEQLLQQAKPV